MEIELDVFSGVPNPRWTLSGAEARRLVALLPATPEPEREGLGFRGFVLHNPEREFGLPDVVELGPGTGELAAFLTAQAIHHGYAHLL
ncbi:hypothetical protein NLX83_26160 [Allokutzneria sp. A3M-2-11 16]|uniref:hypothetical protein n=1 Tax=Allokutzneria sp. A3M-2-11 16 TaxID=2962043 RepID=UPI0020B662E8|nr:hypothetical protein [Allokutzneria sp. A3M-2-11 16]MCP3802763.1 hypothetical protein [Allokutzneria sp. A3M-2-11 16]